MIYLQNYVPTVFENYTASFEIDKHRIELNMWDTSGKNCFRFCSTRGDGSLCPLQMDTFAFGLDFSISSRGPRLHSFLGCPPCVAGSSHALAFVRHREGWGIKGCGCG